MPTSPNPSLASPTASKPFLPLYLADEIWLDILIHCSYGALKTLERVCMKLQRLTKSPNLDSLLFRAPPLAKRLSATQRVGLHPLLARLNPVNLTPDRAFFPPSPSSSPPSSAGTPSTAPRSVDAYRLKAAHEYATSPACTTLAFDVDGRGLLSISHRSGVRVRRVLKSIGTYLASKPSPAVAVCAIRLGWEKDWQDLTLADMLGLLSDTTRWSGWEAPRVGHDGGVVLINRGRASNLPSFVV
ncbi:hypothetical protein JCM10207_005042 [Rhodosporidiobolus poonsookiae]